MAKSGHDNHILDIVVVLLVFCTGCSAQCTWQNRPQELQATYYYQYFTSPGYADGEYPINSNCAWQISAQRGFVVQIQGTLNLEQYSSACRYDNVTVYDGDSEYSQELGKVCGSTYARFQSTGPNMYVKFTSDSTISLSGFRFTYRASRYNYTFLPSTTTTTTTTTLCNSWGCTAQCPGQGLQALRATFIHQHFTSPGYANGEYPENSNCAWLISAGPGYVVQIHGPLNLESNVNCGFDSVTVYDGETQFSPELGRVCGRTHARFQSTGQYMYIYFTSDSSINLSGFRFTYWATRYDPTFLPPTTTTTTLWNPWGQRTSTATSSSFGFVHNHVSTAAVIGGIVGSIVFVFLCVGLGIYFHNRRRQQQISRQVPAFMTRASGSGPAHGNNTVVMTATGGVQATRPSGGNVNLGYLPPSYDSLHLSGPPANSMALPSYSEAITMSGVSDTPKPN